MKVLVVGSGAREHTMVWTLSRNLAIASHSSSRDRVFCAPGNAGTEALAHNIPVVQDDVGAIITACREFSIDLVIVGPENSLAAGIVDALQLSGIAAFGPARKAAVLESSKSFARAFSERHGVPCAATARFSCDEVGRRSFKRFMDENRGRRLVLKKSGLAAGKGVLESDDLNEQSSFGMAVLESDELLAEEFLVGRELSIFAVCDGSSDRLLLLPCMDHKKAGSGDSGPNTGGMGVVCPVRFADAPLLAKIEREIVDRSFHGMEQEGLTYRGVLFFGVMVTADGPKLLEYNVRFGDPETQSLLPLLASSFLELCLSAARGRLCSIRPTFSDMSACGVVVAAPGYPGNYQKGLAVDLSVADASVDAGIPESGMEGSSGTAAFLFHASTARDPTGILRTGGGRCFTSVGIGHDPASARSRAYDLAKAVKFEGAWYRPDIGNRQ